MTRLPLGAAAAVSLLVALAQRAQDVAVALIEQGEEDDRG